MDKDIVIPSTQQLRSKNSGEVVTKKKTTAFEKLLTEFKGSVITTKSKGPRITVPLPPEIAGLRNPEEKTPSILLDSEWFFLDSYPEDIRPYLVSRFDIDTRPKTSEDIVRLSAEFLRQSYLNLQNLNLNIPIDPELDRIFKDLVSYDSRGNPRHPYDENDKVKNLYLILAYVLSVSLWKVGAARQIRNYDEPTYPGVIAATLISRLDAFYHDVSSKLHFSSPLIHKEDGNLKSILLINSIPTLTFSFRTLSQLVNGKIATTSLCSNDFLNLVKDVNSHLGLPEPSSGTCQQYLQNLLVFSRS